VTKGIQLLCALFTSIETPPNGPELSCGVPQLECFCERNSLSYRGALAIINRFLLERSEFALQLEPFVSGASRHGASELLNDWRHLSDWLGAADHLVNTSFIASE
jgi:hypothetical protein